MNWVDIAWPMMGGACLMLGFVHGLAWVRRPRGHVHLVFAVACLSVVIIAAMERLLMQAANPAEYAALLRWAHVPGAIMFISLAVFVHLQFRASRAWLCALACAGRAAALAANFTTGVNINYSEVYELRMMQMLGGVDFALPIGQVNPWMGLGQASIAVFVWYMVDTMVREWRSASREDRWSAVRVCGGITLFVVIVNGWRLSVVMGWLVAPDALMPAFLFVLVVMSHELGAEILRSADLAVSLAQTRERLRESVRRSEVAAQAGELGLWGWHMVENRRWVTDLGLKLLGFQAGQPFNADELDGRTHPDDRKAHAKALELAQQNGGDYRVDFRVRTEDGDHRHLSVRGQMERSESGQPESIHGIIIDVTERVRQQERFELAVEASPTAMLMTNRAGRITLANHQAELVFGYPRAELLGMAIEMLLPERLRAVHQGLRQSYGAAPTARLMGAGRELHGLHKDGHEFPVEVAINPIRLENEGFVLASVADISDRRRLESEAARHRNELAHLSRVALLAELSGSLAHELNQPLTAILSNAQAATRFLAMDPPELGEVAESLANIVDSDKRAGEVIRRLRAMLRKEPVEHRPLDLNEVVADVLRIIRSDLLNRSTKTVLELDPHLSQAWGDRIQLQQVLLNLITNGSDAMADLPRGHTLLIRTQSQPDGSIRVSVVDSGRGIPPDQLEGIFQPFFSTKPEGMGLGLAVCTTIIESHGGRLWAVNNAGPGASLHFTLPKAV